jgi:hypothetical protein
MPGVVGDTGYGSFGPVAVGRSCQVISKLVCKAGNGVKTLVKEFSGSLSGKGSSSYIYYYYYYYCHHRRRRRRRRRLCLLSQAFFPVLLLNQR